MNSLIIGSGGQDGQLLTRYLDGKGDKVVGLGRGEFDFSNARFVEDIVSEVDRIYYLPAHHTSSEGQSGPSVDELQVSFQTHCLGLQAILQVLAKYSRAKQTNSGSKPGPCEVQEKRLFYAASSLVFGNQSGNFDENSHFDPNCIYGMTKTMGIELCRLYREKFKVFASVGILFNHESCLRKSHFLSKKIVRSVCEIQKGCFEKLQIGNLEAQVDWSHAVDFVEAFYLILNRATESGNFVVGSGILHSVREFIGIAFSTLGLNWQEHVICDPNIINRNPPTRVASPKKLKEELGWQPKFDFKSMVEDLVIKEKEASPASSRNP